VATMTQGDRPGAAAAGDVRNVLELRQIEVVYNKVQVAVAGLSLVVPEGKIVAVLGPNGAGKTTMLRAITGFLRSETGAVTDGDILLDGESIRGLPPHVVARKGVCLMPEEQAIFASLSVDDNLRVVPHPGGDASRAAAVDRIFELFPRLKERRNQIAGYMSGGERKMLAMARVLLLQPRVMLIDELSFGLAPVVVDLLVGVLADINRTEGTSVLLVEQNAAAALSIAHFGYIIETGKVAFTGTPAELGDNPAVREAYLGLSQGEGHRSYAEVARYRRRRRWGG
jgi:branched-chain amino acid transport system ATP-binding protein